MRRSLAAATSTEGSRLEDLRQQLREDDEALAQEAAAAPPPASRRKRKQLPKPSWLKVTAAGGEARENFNRLRSDARRLNLATVCEEAQCPNIGECWGGKEGTATATIMIMGDTCTRGCSFCAVKTSRCPAPLDPEEPANVAEAVRGWDLGYVVLTSVDRDDVPDGGAAHFAATVRELAARNPALWIEALTPDFLGVHEHVDVVATSGLHVYAHNLETVERMQRRVRDYRAGYAQSLAVLERAKVAAPQLLTKTSLMLGVGERPEEIEQTLADLRGSGVDVVTFGQYLRPSRRHMAVKEYVTPEAFDEWGLRAEQLGFKYAASGPLVRSSYKAGEFFLENLLRERQAEAQATVG